MLYITVFCCALLLSGFHVIDGGTASTKSQVATPCGDVSVDVTWLGVTMYLVRYWHAGREVKLLLDDNVNRRFISPLFDDVLNLQGNVDMIFIGHMHFDHNGACPEWPIRHPRDFHCAPFQDQAANLSAKVMAPLAGCNLVHSSTECIPLVPSADNVPVYEFQDIGLRVTAIPNAHSYLWEVPHHGSRGPPGCSGGILGLGCPDAFAFLFEFLGEGGSDETCTASVFWADTAHNRAPYLDGYSEVGVHHAASLNYSKLYRQAFEKKNGTTLMAFPSFFLPEAGWQEFASIVRPAFHTNHHHGDAPDDLFPDLRHKMPGSALGTPPASWLLSASVPAGRDAAEYIPKFVQLNDYFDTIRLRGPSTVEKVDLGYAAAFRANSRVHVVESKPIVI